MTEAIVKAVSLLVTVKTRLGWDETVKILSRLPKTAGRRHQSHYNPWKDTLAVIQRRSGLDSIGEVRNNPR